MISFAVSLAVTITGIGYLHESRWIRGFLALGLLYVVTSSFTLAKCVRDRQEETALLSRVDQARLDKLLTGKTSFASRTTDGNYRPSRHARHAATERADPKKGAQRGMGRRGQAWFARRGWGGGRVRRSGCLGFVLFRVRGAGGGRG